MQFLTVLMKLFTEKKKILKSHVSTKDPKYPKQTLTRTNLLISKYISKL